ncbi:MAG: lysophospholipid acyltransferase family protein [Chloroflexota bacterium]|nr:lysophospholipid acyltransferase family protein [Dehalococcoidia bacterium]MDW8254575.1 lysophospholipid acyltransferase family protein [Chloroflexota bacterium]
MTAALLAFRLGTALAPRLPRSVLVALALPFADLLAARNTPQNRAHRRNIARVVGRSPADPSVRQLARRAVRVQTLNYLDLFRSRRLSRAELLARVEMRGLEHLQRALAGARGAVVISGHVGSVDMAGLALTALGLPGAALVEPLQPPELFALVAALRERFGGQLIPLGPDAVKRAGTALRQNAALGIAIDWDISGTGIEVPLFGHRMRLPAGPAIVALRYGAPLVPLTCIRVGLTRFRLTIEPPLPAAEGGTLHERTRATTERIAGFLERQLRAAPDQWVMFHNVWADPLDD